MKNIKKIELFLRLSQNDKINIRQGEIHCNRKCQLLGNYENNN